MSKRKVTRYYYETWRVSYDDDTPKCTSARRRLSKKEAAEILEKAGFTLNDFPYDDDSFICVKRLGLRKSVRNFRQHWFVVKKVATFELDCYCDEGLEI